MNARNLCVFSSDGVFGRHRIEAPAGSKLSFQELTLGDQEVVEATHHREVRLDQDGKELKGVVAYAPEPVLVGGVLKSAAVFNMLPDPSTTEDEVHAFVGTLLSNENISFDSKRPVAKAAAITGPNKSPLKYTTHIIKLIRGKKVLTRVRYL